MKKKIGPLEIVLGLVLLFHAFLLIGLIFWALFNSFKSSDAFAMDPLFLSKEMLDGLATVGEPWFYPQNYANAFKGVIQYIKIDGVRYKVYLPEMFWNSILYSVGCAFFATLTPCLVAYVTSKYKSRFNAVVYGIVIFVMVTPVVGSLPSQIQMAKRLGFFDSQVGLWFMSATFLGTYYLVFYGIFKGLSWEYAEAAFIDGASHFKVLVNVMLPLVRSTFFVVMLLNFIGFWNDYQRPLIFLPNHPTAAIGIYFSSRGGVENSLFGGVPLQLAGGILMLTPILVIFIVFREKFVGNLTVGGIKG